MAFRASGTLILACLIWIFFLCATIAFFQLKLVENGTHQASSSDDKTQNHHHSVSLLID